MPLLSPSVMTEEEGIPWCSSQELMVLSASQCGATCPLERRSPYLQRSNGTRGYVGKERNDGPGKHVFGGQDNIVECIDLAVWLERNVDMMTEGG